MLKNPSPISHDPRLREFIFWSLPARLEIGRSRPTMRFRTFDSSAALVQKEGGNKSSAGLQLSHLLGLGHEHRIKLQPRYLLDDGDPDGFPDLLVELASEELVVVEVKPAKYLTLEHLEGLHERDAFIRSKGIVCSQLSDRQGARVSLVKIECFINKLLDIDRWHVIALMRELLERRWKTVSSGLTTLEVR